jgi:hypothetical protein
MYYYLDVDNSVVHVFYYLSVSDIWSGKRGGLIRVVAYLDVDNSVVHVFYYLIVQISDTLR